MPPNSFGFLSTGGAEIVKRCSRVWLMSIGRYHGAFLLQYRLRGYAPLAGD
jgi:hypothetical protein